ncbi:chain length determinant protein tyrosine kinase EpsG [Methylobacillus arboreus]|uniref:chain length determinant protein tyrosine kinase EpsG n=1 Tax=Methylobacillus arboreus TaxID=755170 RepID=UPI001E4F3F45|nr:chain length determinant protein tyrosine kinase EpsG [Methylobacillus arboreus]MCB5189214.1 chain length determinant protein tyrosine kinase EpsG [Methylobacillus arboreus]
MSSTQHSVASTDKQLAVDPFSEFNIGSLLLRMGKISPEDAEKIMKLHKDQGMRFGEAAKSLGLITEGDIQQVLARQFDYPYLIQESNSKHAKELVSAYQPFSKKSEVFRAVRSQLMLHWFSPERKALSFSSMNAGEGVSYFVSNLAIVFAQLGENTLLIDANLRSPRQHDIFELEERKGLSDILAGRAGQEVISKVGVFESLSVLPAGTLPPNPQELVSRPSFRKLIYDLSNQYDVILLDTPAFSYGADVQAISTATNGLVMVIKNHEARMNDISAAAESLANNGTHIVGSVLVEF